MRAVGDIEADGRALFLPYLEATSDRVVDTNAFRSSEAAQRTFGDFLVWRGAQVLGWELKVEQAYTGNLFLEAFSNAWPGRHERAGWLYTLRADYVTFVFLSNRTAFTTELPALREWFEASVPGNPQYEPKFPRRAQRNLTVGYPVSIADLWQRVRVECVRFDAAGRWVPAGLKDVVFDWPDWPAGAA